MAKKKASKSNRKQKEEQDAIVDEIMQEQHDDSNDDEQSDLAASSDDDGPTSMSDHKNALTNLKKTDPKFFKFLKQNDEELLEFSDEDESDDDDENQVKREKFHSAPDKLEVASDDSDQDQEDDRDEQRSGGKVNVAKINTWRKQLQTKPKIKLIKLVVGAFESAVNQASGAGAQENETVHVRGAPAFNAIIKLCMVDLQEALHKLLRLPWPPTHKLEPTKCKLWIKLRKPIKVYLMNVLNVLSAVSDSSIIEAVLKHVHQMIPFVLAAPKICKLFIKALIKLWGTSEESARILAFLSIMAICRQNSNLLDAVLKQMYMCYVNNCKFTSVSTWPLINFMKRSLVEVYALDEVLCYQHAFVYIRQLAIHLRNAITISKKDSIQSVYNWQYIHCMLLWTHLLATSNSPVLEPLVYPLVQTIVGAIRLVPTAKYLPLRLHCISALTSISSRPSVFVPTLPFALEILDLIDLNKKHSSVSLKPVDFTCILKLSKKQLSENGLKDQAIASVYESIMDYLHTQSHKIGYPELVLALTVKLKTFVKTCKIANHCKQLKQLMDKVIENSKFITDQRKSLQLALSDSTAVEIWENHVKESGTPITKFYTSWRKMKDEEKSRMIAKGHAPKEQHVLPDMPKHKKTLKKKAEGKRKAGQLFSESDDDSDIDISKHLAEPIAKKPKKEKPKIAKKEKAKTPKQNIEDGFNDDHDDADDQIQDFVLSSSDGELSS